MTEVYLDSDDGMITIVSVNSYLAKATSDYSESKEYAPLNVYVKDADGRNYNVDVSILHIYVEGSVLLSLIHIGMVRSRP